MWLRPWTPLQSTLCHVTAHSQLGAPYCPPPCSALVPAGPGRVGSRSHALSSPGGAMLCVWGGGGGFHMLLNRAMARAGPQRRHHEAQRGRADTPVSVPCPASATRLGAVSPPQVGRHISRPRWGLRDSTSHPTGLSPERARSYVHLGPPGSFGRAGLSCSPQSPPGCRSHGSVDSRPR